MIKIFTYLLTTVLSLNALSQTLTPLNETNASLTVYDKFVSSSLDTKSAACSGTINGIIQPVSCADIGTAAFDTKSPTVSFADQTGTNTPASILSTNPSCGGAPNASDGWIHYDLAAGVTQVNFSFIGGGVAGGFDDLFFGFYQGVTCAALSQVGCQLAVQKVPGGYNTYNIFQSGLNPTLDLWVYYWTPSNKAFTLSFQAIGSTAPPANDNCATATSSLNGCNVGADPNTFTTPGAAGVACTGGNWGSNENTVYFSFVANATTGSIDVENVICNNGVAGNAQFGVWTSCACVGTYTAACYKGCAVGAGVLSLTTLTPGQTYIIAVDGFAGDVCRWNFVVTNITLPVELLSFSAQNSGRYNTIEWQTSSENNSDYFEVWKSIDGVKFELFNTTNSAGNSTELVNYSTIDENPSVNTYYKLIQYDNNGESFEYKVVLVSNVKIEYTGVVPNPTLADSHIDFESSINTESKLTILDPLGKVVFQSVHETTQGANTIQLKTSELSSGIYTVILENGLDRFNSKFIKL